MRSNLEYTPRQQYDWDTTSHDYNDHLLRMQRMPSVLTDDVPQYQNVHKIFNNKYTYTQEGERKTAHEEHKQNPPKARKKVHVSEHVETIEVDNHGDCEVTEQSIDMEADDYIQQRHRGFQLCKWKTFKSN
ncbi:hypothetical protein CFOL_v3_08648 [Cephalotus follicularis]|uniref:Uncharacterized protein n=1 Tax=Cephalotus follicularis TaxID=3775 RepID=A0A1Q3BBI3_CEPFO|nr:hypothetical protein CFOL_v3_08648 [Cephalotus follicularis]